jgi:pimeloyl-ACP methyl ester carboxylesterase
MTRWKTFRGLSTVVVAVALLVAATATGATEQQQQNRGVTNIVLVHGAWADGSSWSKVIPLLEAKGLHVVAVQLPLTSQADDVATVQRAIALVGGRLLLVAHSYGGAVMTQAGNDPKVAGLVYVAAFAPAEGESPFDLAGSHPDDWGLCHRQSAFRSDVPGPAPADEGARSLLGFFRNRPPGRRGACECVRVADDRRSLDRHQQYRP